ncbi:MAG: hypothetical protein ACE5KA_03915 [Nitrososphaerales archaeon]
MDLEKFTRDVNEVAFKSCVNEDQLVLQRVNFVKQRLIDLYKRNLVKINHSVMEIVCAKQLIKYGYDVDVERQLSDTLVCDVHATKGDGSFVVEIETGFTPPEHALDPLTYYIARIASKIARYSPFASKFALATPLASILPIPEIFLKPPKYRKSAEVNRVKELCDKYYKNPPLDIKAIINARLHSIYLINIDDAKITELDPDTYQALIEDLNSLSSFLL